MSAPLPRLCSLADLPALRAAATAAGRTVAMANGVFDLFHVGHVRLLRRLRELGDRLVVGCSTDEFNARKGKKAILPYDQRVEVLRSCRHVDDIFPEEDWAQKRGDILRMKADIFAMGDDWVGKFDDLGDICRVPARHGDRRR